MPGALGNGRLLIKLESSDLAEAIVGARAKSLYVVGGSGEAERAREPKTGGTNVEFRGRVDAVPR